MKPVWLEAELGSVNSIVEKKLGRRLDKEDFGAQ